jgi:Uma2 family endonuclease
VAATLVSLEEYLHTSYHPDMEYVDGVLVRRNAGTYLHSLLQALVVAYLSQFRKTHHISVLTECRLLLDAQTGRHRIPDVMVLEHPFAKTKVLTDIPSAVIEIKSPDDTLDEVFDKCLEYGAFGVPNIIVLDPDHKRPYVFTNNALRLVTSISLAPRQQPALPLPVDTLFAELDEAG